MPSRLSAARSSSLGSEDTFTLATPSTITLMNSLVGTASLVFTSTVITCRDSLSTLSRKGMRHPALPIRIRRLPRPEIMNAVSGGAFRYPMANSAQNNTTITPRIK